jgi:molybdopterin-guanine dinucleotide biosynthesis protein A
MDRLTIVLLAGGRATRLPGKLTLEIGNEPMLLRVFRKMRASGYPCLLSMREPLSPDLQEHIDAQIVYDVYEDAGPLGGLSSAAAQVQTPLLFAAAADLPNLDFRAVDVLLGVREREKQGNTPLAEAIVPRHADGNIEPLAALYDTNALLTSSRQSLLAGRKRVSEALANLCVLHYDIPPAEEARYLNVNTIEDFERVTAS